MAFLLIAGQEGSGHYIFVGGRVANDGTVKKRLGRYLSSPRTQ